MGLDITHGCWHGSFLDFMRWRVKIGKSVGINLRSKRGYGGEGRFNEDPVNILLGHSDCDGEITANEAVPLANRLEELLPKLNDRHKRGYACSDRGRAETFITGLRDAIAAGESVVFIESP